MEEKKELRENSPNRKTTKAFRKQSIFPYTYRAHRKHTNDFQNSHTKTTNQLKRKVYAQLFGR
jgi:hypothetical protein